jgi:hypothetical protein
LELSARGEPIKVLIIGNAEAEQIGVLSNGLAHYLDFETINMVEWSDAQSISAVPSYDALIATVKYIPVANSESWGDAIANFARSGGGVTCGHGYYDSGGPPEDYGQLSLAENNPFPRGPRLTVGELGDTLIPGHPLMDGVNALTTNYRYDIAPNSNAVVVATFTDGLPLAGYLDVGDGRVVGIQAHFRLDPVLQNNGDFMQLYRNAVVFSVARPKMLSVSVEGADARIEWRGIGGGSCVVQAATDLSSTNSFADISAPIALAGPGFVITNYVDSGALMNHSARFYRVRE